MREIKRKIYKRGGSSETTIPQALLLTLDPEKKHNILFKFDTKTNRWYIEFEENKDEKKKKEVKKRGRKKK